MAKRTYNSSDTDVQPKNERRIYDGVVMNDAPQKASDSVNQKSRVTFNIITTLVSVAFLLGGLYFGFKFFQEEKKNADVVQLWDDVKDVANEDNNGDELSGSAGLSSEYAYSVEPIAREINWGNLLKINTDVKCWIYIPETSIDYPIMQEQKYGQYFYLNRDIYKNDFVSGSLFTPQQPAGYAGKDAHLLVFGHNMRNGTMFSSLSKYKNEQFYKDNPYIYVYYPDRTEKWQVWSAYHTDKYDPVYSLPYEYNTQAYADLLDDIESKRKYTTISSTVTSSMPILSLSTCDKSDGTNTGRYVVNAVLVETKTFN